MNATLPIPRLPGGSSEPKMSVELITLCEEAWERAGRLDLLGAFDLITVPELPCAHRASKLVVRMRFSHGAFGPHYFTLRWLDPAGRELIPPHSGPFFVAPVEADRTAIFNLILALPELPLTLPGEYRCHFALTFGGRVEASLPFHVCAWTHPAPAGNGADRRNALRTAI